MFTPPPNICLYTPNFKFLEITLGGSLLPRVVFNYAVQNEEHNTKVKTKLAERHGICSTTAKSTATGKKRKYYSYYYIDENETGLYE